MAILNNSNAISTSGDYAINNSLRFRSSASAYLNRTPASATNRTTWTLSAWVKRGTLGTEQIVFNAGTTGSSDIDIFFTTDQFMISDRSGWSAKTTQLFRDPSAWYHLVVAFDTTQATSTNRIKIYVNGTQVTALTATYPSQNATSSINNNVAHRIGTRSLIDNLYDGYIAEFNFIDGTALTPSSFGETDTTTGSWKPKAYTSTYGTNGFYLKFSDIATTSGSNAGLGKDFSGNANYWTTNNISVTAGVTYDAMIDSPTLTSATVANYCTWNPLTFRISAATTFSNANLTSTFTTGGYATAYGTIAVTSGKYYWEVTVDTVGGDSQIGISEAVSIDSTSAVYRVYRSSGQKQTTGNVSSTYGSSYTTSDIIGVALDIDSGTITFYKNNTSQGTAFTDIASALPSTGWTPYGYGYSGNVLSANFGQRPFTYTPPTGYVRLNTYNLPDSTIPQGNKYMDATTYTGTGATATITNAGAFKPDFVWTKARSAAITHLLYDSVRGATKYLQSASTSAEGTGTDSLTAFASNGFTVGADTSTTGVNQSGTTYVGWQWQAGQGSTSSNTSGSITSTVSVNTTAGFSVVTWTATGSNATIGHGLGVAPKMIITKGRNAVNGWNVYTSTTGNGNYLRLDTTAASTSGSTYWNNTSPTSTVFSTGTWYSNTETYVAYCWAEIAGFSKAFSYTGNGSTDGTFVYLGFRPKFLLIKSSSNAQNWHLIDTARDTYNLAGQGLDANTSAAEYTPASSGYPMDILSNGFKIRYASEPNISSATYIGMAFAENPFKNSLAR